ncbi:hypothetical protein HC928_02200 [bacterium]|nr:hypothetical protein [bacterium]
MRFELKLTLLSDATFGRGDGVSGLVDQEIEYDSYTGLPFVRGRTLKGLLVEECANILYALELAQAPGLNQLEDTARVLFGRSGSLLEDSGCLFVGNAQLPEALQVAIRQDIDAGHCQATDILEMFTAVRRQTSVDETTGAPERKSLRSSRVLLRKTTLTATLDLALPEGSADLNDARSLLCACVAALRHGGSGRNRGRGALYAELSGVALDHELDHFEALARGGQ